MATSQAFKTTFGLIVTFGGIGVLVNALLIYAVAQVLGERSENRRIASELARNLPSKQR